MEADEHGSGWTTAEPSRLWIRHPAEPRELRHIRIRVAAWARCHALPENVLTDLQLAVGEAVANGVEHAFRDRPAGVVEVELEIRARRRGSPAIGVRVLDDGAWRPAPPSPGFRGRGLSLIEHIADRLEVSATSAGTVVCFEIPL